MKMAEIMTKHVHTIGTDQTLKECAELLKQLHVNGLVVVNDGKVAGVITKADIFEAVLPGYSDIIEDENNIASFEYIEKQAAQKLNNKKVQYLMGTPPITITSKTPIVKAGSLMILRRIKGRLSGIVTLTDIINSITDKFE